MYECTPIGKHLHGTVLFLIALHVPAVIPAIVPLLNLKTQGLLHSPVVEATPSKMN